MTTAGIPLLPTGVAGFDEVLGGGLPANGLYLIQGLAGSGKTTLACQIGFNHARQGKKVLIMTLIAESHGKLVKHLGNYTFYDESLLGRQVLFFSGYTHLAKGGLQELLGFIAANLAQHQPDVFIIDGFRSVRETSSSGIALSEFMHSLNSLVASMGCISFVLSPVEGNSPGAENTLVDGIIELGQFERGLRVVRELKVFKVRGGKHLLGKHMFDLNETGITVYPRLEAVATRANTAPAASEERVSFGIAGWDAVTAGGVAKGSTTNLLGHPGIGKTLMGLHFIQQGLREQQNCLILGFYESPQRLVQKAEKVGIDLAQPLANGSLEIIWTLPLEVIVDDLVNRVLENLDRRQVTRLFVDGVEGLRDVLMYPERVRSVFIALVNELRARGVTTIFTQELPYFKESFATADSSVSVLFENMMLLRYVEIDAVNYRQISVMKLRDSGYDPANYVVTISDAGVSIDGTVSALIAKSQGRSTPHED